jgi:uncharacterized membrane protein
VKSKLGRADAAALALLTGSFATTLALYDRLPARIPTHFNIHGVPNGWMSRSVGSWVLPMISLAAWALLRPGARLLPSDWRTRMQESPMGVVAVLLVAVMSALQGVTIYAAIVKPRSVGGALALVLAGFWIALGLVLPRIRRNPWVGVRTAWTLSSDENWARTHRVAGFAFVIGGVLTLFFDLAGSMELGLGILLASAIVPAVYSLLLARRLSSG